MMNHDQAIEWMIKQRNKEIGFSSFQKYLNEHENHLGQLNIVHIAGTNGKGSTVSMMMHCLKEAGYKVGTFTSPHLFVHEDRIRINGQILPEDDFLRIFNSRKEVWENYQLSMFEMDLDIASTWFCEQNVDIVLLEAGLGGKDDSTNVIASSLASVIVSVGLDHMDRLGDTVEKIAEQKAGIIKKNGLVICGERKTGCYEVIQKIAEKKHAELIQMQAAEVRSENPIIFDYRGLQFELSERALYQVHNACCAIETILQLRKRKMISISNDNLINGIKKAHWAGRFDVVDETPLTIVDGAHNSHGIQALKESAKNLKRPLIGVFACLKDKDKDEMIASLSQIVDELILTEFDFYRAMPVEQLKATKNCLKYSDWKEAVKIAQGKAKEGTVLITGSLYFISEVMTYFKEKNSYPNCSFDSNASASTEEDNSTRTCA